MQGRAGLVITHRLDTRHRADAATKPTCDLIAHHCVKRCAAKADAEAEPVLVAYTGPLCAFAHTGLAAKLAPDGVVAAVCAQVPLAAILSQSKALATGGVILKKLP